MTATASILRRVCAQLEAARIPYMVAGSVAATRYGLTRSTQDIDIVIDPTMAALEAFVSALDPDAYYADVDTARDALRRRSLFNIVDMETGWKVDLVIRKDRPFSVEELRRRQATTMFGVPVFVVTAEDSIVSKLEWAKLGESERQLRDVAGIVAAQQDGLDLAYIERWVDELGLRDHWDRARLLA